MRVRVGEHHVVGLGGDPVGAELGDSLERIGNAAHEDEILVEEALPARHDLADDQPMAAGWSEPGGDPVDGRARREHVVRPVRIAGSVGTGGEQDAAIPRRHGLFGHVHPLAGGRLHMR